MRSFDENLRFYAQLTIKEGLGLAVGQELIMVAEIDQRQFVQLIVEEAYKAGAKNVEVLWKDPEVIKTRLRDGSDEAIAYAPIWLYDGITQAHRDGAARLGVASSDPQMLAGLSPERISTSSTAQSKATKPTSELISGFAINWCIVGAASVDWASRVFPDLPATEGVAKLWDKIFMASRILEEDPLTAWATHCETLESKVVYLNELRLDALHFTGPGTDLTVGLVEGHEWAGGRGYAKNGIRCSPNIPTEEVFTMPHRAKVNGVVSSTMPLSLRGQMVDKIRSEFKDGVAVNVTAEVGQSTFENLINTDDGARRLGEVALVPNSCKVGQTGTLFLNTLYDENAACHIAMGASYSENLTGIDDMTDAEKLERGANDSLIHVDWMIGSAQVDIDGIKIDGSVVPLMRAGEWV